jgi:sterol 14alpha-demethylase
MGILESIKEPFVEVIAQRGLGLVLGAAVAAFVALSVVLNVFSQVLFKNPNEPPVVFHWLPIIGSTITYGIDPYKFFFECRAKVCGSYYVVIVRARKKGPDADKGQ